jgi:hypothetical protein
MSFEAMLSKRSRWLRLLQGMSDQADKSASKSEIEKRQDDRYPSQAEGDRETVEEDLKEKSDPPSKSEGKA